MLNFKPKKFKIWYKKYYEIPVSACLFADVCGRIDRRRSVGKRGCCGPKEQAHAKHRSGKNDRSSEARCKVQDSLEETLKNAVGQAVSAKLLSVTEIAQLLWAARARHAMGRQDGPSAGRFFPEYM